MVKTLQQQVYEIEKELKARMDETGAQRWENKDYVVEYVPQVEYDRTRLAPLLEYSEIPDEAIGKAFTPEHQVTVPASWDMRFTKTLGKYSARATAIIESAKIPSNPKFSIKRKEGKP